MGHKKDSALITAIVTITTNKSDSIFKDKGSQIWQKVKSELKYVRKGVKGANQKG